MQSWIFPGQGSQSVGMCKDFFDKHTKYNSFFEQAENITNMPLRKYIWIHGEEYAQFFQQTDVIQPAIYTISCAMAQFLIDNSNYENNDTIVVAGHSLGEYAALFAAGYISFEAGLKLLALRSKAMQAVCSTIDSGMLACLFPAGTTDSHEQAKALALEAECEVANYNSPEQIVLSGYSHTLDKAAELASHFKVLKTVRLNVAGAYHSSLMKPAADAFAKDIETLLSQSSDEQPKLSLICNRTGTSLTTADLKTNMIEQIYSPVQWTKTIQTILNMLGNEVTFLELGPGNVLSKMLIRQKLQAQTLMY